MPTTADFDTLFPHDITGEITATITDQDDTPNHVLDKNQSWQVRVRWSLVNHNYPSANLSVIAGHWKLTAFLEAVGVAEEAFQGQIAMVNIPYGAPAATVGNWNATLPVPAGTVTVGGVYKVTVMLAFHTTGDIATDMVGFVECPMIAFHE